MNVDILESNPDWRWYLLLSGACLTLTVVAWLLSKYCEVRGFDLLSKTANAHIDLFLDPLPIL